MNQIERLLIMAEKDNRRLREQIGALTDEIEALKKERDQLGYLAADRSDVFKALQERAMSAEDKLKELEQKAKWHCPECVIVGRGEGKCGR